MVYEIKRKYDRSIIYSQCGKRIEEELTYERFVNELCLRRLEFEFKYGNLYLDIAYHFDKNKIVYELNINDNTGQMFNYYYNNSEELLNARIIEGKTIKEIWTHLKT